MTPNTLLANYLTTDQLAQELGISPRTLYRWSMSRYGPPKVKIGWRSYYRRDAVIEWILAREVTQAAAVGRRYSTTAAPARSLNV